MEIEEFKFRFGLEIPLFIRIYNYLCYKNNLEGIDLGSVAFDNIDDDNFDIANQNELQLVRDLYQVDLPYLHLFSKKMIKKAYKRI